MLGQPREMEYLETVLSDLAFSLAPPLLFLFTFNTVSQWVSRSTMCPFYPTSCLSSWPFHRLFPPLRPWCVLTIPTLNRLSTPIPSVYCYLPLPILVSRIHALEQYTIFILPPSLFLTLSFFFSPSFSPSPIFIFTLTLFLLAASYFPSCCLLAFGASARAISASVLPVQFSIASFIVYAWYRTISFYCGRFNALVPIWFNSGVSQRNPTHRTRGINITCAGASLEMPGEGCLRDPERRNAVDLQTRDFWGQQFHK